MIEMIPKPIRSLVKLIKKPEFRERVSWQFFCLYALNELHARRRYRELIHSSPVVCATASDVSAKLVFLTSGARHVVDAIYSAKSFLFHAERPLRVNIIADGSIGPEHVALFERQLPNVTVLNKEYRDQIVEKVLNARNLPRCIEWRRTNVLAPKLIDPIVFSDGDSILQLDSDIVTLKPLSRLFSQIKNNPNTCMFGYDREAECYALPVSRLPDVLGVDVPAHINTGLVYMRREAVEFDQIERWLANKEFPAHTKFAEQTLTAAFGAKYGCDFWDRSEFNMGRTVCENEGTLIHYCDYPISETRLAMRRYGQRQFHRQLLQADRRDPVVVSSSDVVPASAIGGVS